MRLYVLISSSVFFLLISATSLLFGADKVRYTIGAICLFLACLLLGIVIICAWFSKEQTLESSVVLEKTLPDSEVSFCKKDGVLAEIKIGNDSYTNIECNTDDGKSLTILKKKTERKYGCITYKTREIYVAVIA